MMNLGLSPMDGVTDAAMRYITAKYGQPKYLFTEFVSVDALHFAVGERREKLLKTLIKARDVDKLVKWPLEIAQIFGHNPEYFKEAAELIESLGFDGIDINMGCPAHKVEEQGSGAGLIRTPERAKEIVKAVKSATKLPVSVKTRIGVNANIVEQWMEQLMEVVPVHITVHGRTLKQMYMGQADWVAIAKAAEVVHKHNGVIFGNGDVANIKQAKEYIDKYKVDGVLIGRAAEGNPFVFKTDELPSWEILQKVMLEHAQIYEQIFGPGYFMPMRKHLAWYCKGFPGAVELRMKLMQTNSTEEVKMVVKRIFKSDLD